MAKRDLDFSVFDKELSETKPDLATRIGVQPAAGVSHDPPLAPTALRVVSDVSTAVDAAPSRTARAKQGEKTIEAAGRATKLRGRVTRSDGSEAGRVIVYLPSDIALRLRRYCFENGRAITEVAGDMLRDAIANGIP
jgi:hypothetical protein